MAIIKKLTGGQTTSEHFRENGHCMESKASGTDVLVWMHLHFN